VEINKNKTASRTSSRGCGPPSKSMCKNTRFSPEDGVGNEEGKRIPDRRSDLKQGNDVLHHTGGDAVYWGLKESVRKGRSISPS